MFKRLAILVALLAMIVGVVVSGADARPKCNPSGRGCGTTTTTTTIPTTTIPTTTTVPTTTIPTTTTVLTTTTITSTTTTAIPTTTTAIPTTTVAPTVAPTTTTAPPTTTTTAPPMVNPLPAGVPVGVKTVLSVSEGMPQTFDFDYGLSPFVPSQFTVRVGGGWKLTAQRDAAQPSGWRAAAGSTWNGIDPAGQGVRVGDYVQALMKLPAGTGLWPAFWLVDWEGGNDVQEIDVMEMLGEDPTVIYHTNHLGTTQTGSITRTGVTVGEYHTFGAYLRSDGQVQFFVDGRSSGTLSYTMNRPTSGAWVCLLNLALSNGGWGVPPNSTTPSPSVMEVVEVARWR